MALLSLLALLVAAAPDVYPHNCTYKQGGTGSVTRACADKFADALAAKEFGAKCDGATDDAPALALANTAAVAQGKAIFIGCKLRIASAAGTVAAGLRFEGAGELDLSPVGGSVTLTGPLTAPVSQVFYTGSGTLTFSAKVAQVVPQWWGAVGDGVTDDTTAVNAAYAAAADATRVLFPCPGPYHTTSGNILCTGAAGRDVPLGAEAATQQVASKLVKGAEDAFITVISDSTSYTSSYLTVPNPDRWVTRFGREIGAMYPAYTVKFNEWDDVTQAYLGWATLATGTSSQTLWIWNASFSGKSSQYILGSHIATMLIPTTPDLLIISHGHNEGATSATWGADMIGMVEEVAALEPNAAILMVGQNPEAAPATGGPNQTLRVARYAEMAARRGYGFLNIYQAFIDYSATWATDLLNADGIHPNDTGSQLWADETARAFAFRKYAPASSRQPASVTLASNAQLLINGDFSEWDGTLPTHWASTGSAFAKDTTNFESTNGYGLNIATTAAAAFIFQTLPLQLVKGKCVTVAGRVYVATGQPLNAGRLFISDNLGNTQSTQTTDGQGAFRWKVIQRCFDPAITTAQVRLYGDASTTSGAATWDRVSVTIGSVPYDVPMVRAGARYYRVAADFTTAANTSLQAITGLTWTIPPLATGVTGVAFPFDCHLLYSQATANAAVAFGTQSGVTMANLNTEAIIRTSATAFTAGTLVAQTTNAQVAVVSATPSAIGTVFGADIHGVQEQSTSGTLNSMQIIVSTAAAADAVTIKRGSYCLVKFN